VAQGVGSKTPVPQKKKSLHAKRKYDRYNFSYITIYIRTRIKDAKTIRVVRIS
jgi:hypothetical protein